MRDVLEWNFSVWEILYLKSLSLLLYPREFHALAYNFSMWIFVGFGYVVYSVLDLGHSRCVLVSLGLD